MPVGATLGSRAGQLSTANRQRSPTHVMLCLRVDGAVSFAG